MRDTLNQIAYDSTTRFTTGTATNVITGNKHEVLVIIVTLIAPLLREGLIKCFDFVISKYFKKVPL